MIGYKIRREKIKYLITNLNFRTYRLVQETECLIPYRGFVYLQTQPFVVI